MKFKVEHPFREPSGSTKNSGIVFSQNYAGDVYARAKVTPADPRTPVQQKAREIAARASRCWTGLTDAARADWVEFTQQFACVTKRRRPMDVCREAQRMRLILGLEPTAEAPQLDFPSKVTAITLEPPESPGEFRFRVRHAVDAPDGHMVIVRITKQMPTVACTPREKEARHICGVGPQSAIALPQSGEVISFTNARFDIAPGARFGVALQVVRAADGLASPVAFFDVKRVGPAAMAATGPSR